MKRVILTFSVGIIFCIFSTSAFGAQPNYYLSGNLGLVFLHDGTLTDSSGSVSTEYDPGFAISGAFGHDYGDFRSELEIAYRTNDFDTVGASGDTTALSFLINGYYDFVSQSPLAPYLGIGIGFANIDVDSLSVGPVTVGNEDDTVLAYQFCLGASYAISSTTVFDLSYRYFATTDPDFGPTESEYKSSNIMFGVRFSY